MTDRSRKKRSPPPPAKPAAAPSQPPRHLVAQFRQAGDPSTEQTEAIRAVIRKFAPAAAVKGEYPGALQIEVTPEREGELRSSLGALPDWDVDTEGKAQMPPKPPLED